MTASEDSQRRPGGKIKKSFIVGVVFLAAVAVAYGAGWMQANAMGEAELTEAEMRIAELREKLELSQAQADHLKATRAQLEARRYLDMTLASLDSRNFGIAQEHLEHAATLLGASNPTDPKLAQLAKDLEQMDLLAATNLENQREIIQGFVTRFDKALPPPK